LDQPWWAKIDRLRRVAAAAANVVWQADGTDFICGRRREGGAVASLIGDSGAQWLSQPNMATGQLKSRPAPSGGSNPGRGFAKNVCERDRNDHTVPRANGPSLSGLPPELRRCHRRHPIATNSLKFQS